MSPPHWRAKNRRDLGKAEPRRPWPRALVVKNGSMARASTSGANADGPSSARAIAIPALSPAELLPHRRQSCGAAVQAWRRGALTARVDDRQLQFAPRSVTAHKPSALDPPPVQRGGRPKAWANRSLAGAQRLAHIGRFQVQAFAFARKASSWPVHLDARARWAWRAISTYFAPAGGPATGAFAEQGRGLPSIACSRLFEESWAMPPVSRPIASSFLGLHQRLFLP